MTADELQQLRGWIACGANNGNPFTKHAARECLQIIRLRRELCRNDTLFEILVSAMARGDRRAALRFCLDWSDPHSLPTAVFKKFVPGDHWHVLGQKFDTWEQAEEYVRQQGYRYGGREIIRTPYDGD